jgi:hypothetical protein
MTPRTRRWALTAIGAIAVLASLDALAHSYTGLYGWAVHHRIGGWQALSWPAEIDVFVVIGELALYVAYLDRWPARQRVWPWVTAIAGLGVSVAGNVGHVEAVPGQVVTLADRVTAAISPVAAFSGLLIGLLVLKMSHQPVPGRAVPAGGGGGRDGSAELVADAVQIFAAARVNGVAVSQRALAAQLRERGHRFSNSQLRQVAHAADSDTHWRAALRQGPGFTGATTDGSIADTNCNCPACA